ncbi:hypothetical protein [Janthinobacterium sp. B9-8]|uniref:hypothetical protein n=1 Tax=Janthinobacterium sp. B9-8 TaxID=1236179 RepID=UPI0007646F10|nr:hypothetical protein [Janthinobacterium sp. B9-8]AMC33830.1 hypothetical protein VN23_04055 [Janthinobacterium sp. B9-8]
MKWLIGLLCSAAFASDQDALLLADQTSAAPVESSDWLLSVEGAWGRARLEHGYENTQRRSLDFRLDTRLAADWRVVLADRLDGFGPGWQDPKSKVNTLKEAYVSWQPVDDMILDFGRINTRYGVGLGYNPSDYFKEGAVRSVVSVAPASLRENRQGSVMLRGQKLWAGGAFTALISPKLANYADRDAFSLDGGASNPRNRYLLALSQNGAISSQFLIFGDADSQPQLGLNLTGLLNDATVLHAELSTAKEGGRVYRLVSGLTWTSESKLSLSLEYQYDGGAKNAAEWQALQGRPLQDYWRYRSEVQSRQSMLTRQATMAQARWPDLMPQLELAAMWRHDLIDSSDMAWFEARYHFKTVDVAWEWQLNRGNALSQYGALPERRSSSLSLKYFF